MPFSPFRPKASGVHKPLTRKHVLIVVPSTRPLASDWKNCRQACNAEGHFGRKIKYDERMGGKKKSRKLRN
jgi:hypothetical protein